MGAFSDQLNGFSKGSVERLTAIYRRSFVLLGDEMAKTKPDGGRVPFKDGHLARSIQASTEAMPKTAPAPFPGSNVGVVAATLRLDQTAWIGYQAIYARRQNYGYVGADKLGRVFNQQGSYFLEYAIEKWPQIVAQAAKEMEAGKK